MESINELANEFSKTRNNEKDFEFILDVEAFEKGFKYAQKWISIDESMPEDHSELKQKGPELQITKPVLVRYENGRYAIDCRRNAGDSYIFWKIEHSGIIEWRPIERF